MSGDVCLFSDQTGNDTTTSTSDEHGPSNSHVASADRRRTANRTPPTHPHAQHAASLQRQRLQQQASGLHQRDAPAGDAGAIVHEQEDVFVVGSPGGLFQSTTDPHVSLYIPPAAIAHTVTLTLQVSQ